MHDIFSENNGPTDDEVDEWMRREFKLAPRMQERPAMGRLGEDRLLRLINRVRAAEGLRVIVDLNTYLEVVKTDIIPRQQELVS